MDVSDGSREKAIHEKASQLVDTWWEQLKDELRDEGTTVNGIALPSYMTAGYTLYYKLKEFVESLGGFVAELEIDKDQGTE